MKKHRIFRGKVFLRTWREASRICIKAKVENQKDYYSRYKIIDGRLPGPQDSYFKHFPGWPIFLQNKKKFFKTWQKARKVAIKAGLNSQRGYFARYKQVDNRLPSDPNVFYEDFPGWLIFFQRDKRYFRTWHQASRVCMKFGVSSQKDYGSEYKHIDGRLHSRPDKYYKDFPGWGIFLGNGQIRETTFVDYMQTDEVIRATVEAFNGNEADIVNILSIISSGKWSRKKMERWMRRPRLSKWIGKFKKPNLDPKAIMEASFKLMPYDKNGIIKDLLLKQLLNWVDQERGSKPTKEQKMQSIKKLQVYVRKLN